MFWATRPHRTQAKSLFRAQVAVGLPKSPPLRGKSSFPAGSNRGQGLGCQAPAAEIALPKARFGIVPGGSGAQRLARPMSTESLAKVLTQKALFGRRIGAARAHQIGFVSDVAKDPPALADEYRPLTASAKSARGRHDP